MTDLQYWRRVAIAHNLTGQRAIDYAALIRTDELSRSQVRHQWLDERFNSLPQAKREEIDSRAVIHLAFKL